MMRILLTNDDGLESPALLPTIRELQQIGEVDVVIPRHQQSWTSKSNTRRSDHIEVETHDVGDITVMTLDALPADCANYGIFKDGKTPDLIISGANVGHNVGIPAFFSSGTIGAALEGLFAEIPSIAISVPYAANSELIPEPFEQSVQGIAEFARAFCEDGPDNVGLAVLNIPYGQQRKELKATTVERFHYGGLFRRKGKHLRPANYHELQYPNSEVVTEGSDVWARRQGLGSVVFMDYDAKFIHPEKVSRWLDKHDLDTIGQ